MNGEEIYEKQTPKFVTPIVQTVEQFPSGASCLFFSLDQSFSPTTDDITRIVEVCSQDLIYERLFKERFKGEPYTEEKAKSFVSWAKDGWGKKEWFVFLVRNPQGKISCCVDIKSNNLDGAEVGYWSSQDSPGIATNAVVTLCDIAKKSGYKKLYVLISPDNTKSIDIAKRAGFEGGEQVTKESKLYLRLEKRLI